jgi:hypothetical protein
MNPKTLAWLVVPYVGWRIYVRLRRTIGEQQFRPARLKISVGIFSLLSMGSAVLSAGHPQLMLGWLGGLVPGVLLGLWALHLTNFVMTSKGRCYTPNAPIGIALLLLFVARIVYRAVALFSHLPLGGGPAPALGESAFTYLTFELLAGYYIAYNAGVLRRYAREDRPPAPMA